MNRNLDLSRITLGNFNLQEFANSQDENEIELKLELVVMAQMVRDVLGRTNITSGYRTPEFNARKDVGGYVNSYHLKGMAIDFRADFNGWTKSALTKLLQSIEFRGYKFHNVNFYWDGNRLDRIHADIGGSWTKEEFNYKDKQI